MDQRLKGIKANSQDFKQYDHVHKSHEYRLVEDQEHDLFDDKYQIETCDLSQYLQGTERDRLTFSKRLGGALEGIGFAVLENHGIPTQLYDQAYSAVKTVFEELPLETRLKYRATRHGSVNQGFFPMKETTNIHPDLVEGWVFCRRAFNLDQDPNFDERAYWPGTELEPIFRKLVQAQERLILPIMRSVLTYLGAAPDLYDERLASTNFALRLNYYPPINQADRESGAGRMLGHEDVDLFTFLPAQEVAGLQVYNRENGKWIRLNPRPGTIILNTGDYMQRITNDRLPSTTHRVSVPDGASHQARMTLPMAIYVWENEILEVLPGCGIPKYDPISALEFHTGTTSKYYGDDYAVNASRD